MNQTYGASVNSRNAKPLYPAGPTNLSPSNIAYIPVVRRKPTQCDCNTKAGEPCTAPKAKGLESCIGHQKQKAFLKQQAEETSGQDS